MNWYWHLPIHLAAVYVTVGLYLGVMWNWHTATGRADRSTSERVALTLFMMFSWVFDIQPADRDHLKPPRKTAASKQLKQEQNRMAIEEAREESAVALLEASVGHRERMAVLHERRRKAEEAA